jgi:hypothetical protein
MRQDVWMGRIGSTLGALIFTGVFQTANAALVSRLNGQAVYDTDLDITWLADANYARTSGISAGGRLSWTDTQSWIASLNSANYLGANNWRLPATREPDPTCSVQPTGSPPYGYDCSGGEMGHLHYTELGVSAGLNVGTSASPSLALFGNFGQDTGYWSGTDYSPNTQGVWTFGFVNGEQQAYLKTGTRYAWAVRSGDFSVAAVPVPAAAWLFVSGRLGLFVVAQRVERQT